MMEVHALAHIERGDLSRPQRAVTSSCICSWRSEPMVGPHPHRDAMHAYYAHVKGS